MTFDGLALDIVLQDFEELCLTGSTLPCVYTYLQYSMWEDFCLSGGFFDNEKNYWLPLLETETVDNLQEISDLKAVADARGISKRVDTVIVNNDLTRFARKVNTTPFALFLGLIRLVLEKLSGRKNFGIMSMVAGRHRPEMENIVGCVAQAVPFYADGESTTVVEYFARLSRATKRTLANSTIPFDVVNTGKAFNIFYQSDIDLTQSKREINFSGDVKGQIIINESPKTAVRDLYFWVQSDSNITFSLEYDSLKFSEEWCSAILKRLSMLTRQIATTNLLCDLSIVLPEEQVLYRSVNMLAVKNFGTPKTISEMILDSAKKFQEKE
jgi:hypothetical protein